jgi:uncharacterized protein
MRFPFRFCPIPQRLRLPDDVATPRRTRRTSHPAAAVGVHFATGLGSTGTSSSSWEEQRIASTHHWFQTVVIGQKLCPFAPPLLKSPDLMRVVCSSQKVDTSSTPTKAMTRVQAIELVQHEALALFNDDDDDDVSDHNHNDEPQHETTLVILDSDPPPSWSTDFREFIRLSWELQEHAVEQTGLMGKLQLVLFHPWATHQTYGGMHDDSSMGSPGDYTIRSPYPTVHLLREVDVLKAVQGGYPHLDTLPARNQAKLMEQGLDVCQRRLADCYIPHGITNIK